MANSTKTYTYGSEVNYTVTIDGEIDDGSTIKLGSLVEVWDLSND